MSPEDEARVRQLIREVMDEDRQPFGNRPRGRDTIQVIADHVAGIPWSSRQFEKHEISDRFELPVDQNIDAAALAAAVVAIAQAAARQQQVRSTRRLR